MSVAIVTVNLLSIILLIKNGSLRTRAMYLVINLTIVDMFVGRFSHFSAGITVISLNRMHATIRPYTALRHRLIKKVSLRGNSCCSCLGFIFNVYYINP